MTDLPEFQDMRRLHELAWAKSLDGYLDDLVIAMAKLTVLRVELQLGMTAPEENIYGRLEAALSPIVTRFTEE